MSRSGIGLLALALFASEISSLLHPARTTPVASTTDVTSARTIVRLFNAKLRSGGQTHTPKSKHLCP
jgi:hypothetical protein